MYISYKRTGIAEARPFVVGEALPASVSISEADRKAGSPKAGDMIARNPANHDDQWLIAADYFAANFAPDHARNAVEEAKLDVEEAGRMLRMSRERLAHLEAEAKRA